MLPLTHAEIEKTSAPTVQKAEGDSASAKSGLQTLSYSEAAAALQPKKSTFFADLFKRIDSNGDKAIGRKEVIAHLDRVGVEAGLFGLVHKTVAKTFMKKLDRDADSTVTMAEFRGVASQLMPPNIFDEDGNLKPELVASTFTSFDADGDGRLTRAEFEQALMEQLPPDTTSRSTVADVMSKLGIDALDLNRDGAVQSGEFSQAADAVAGLKA
jgi:hypothetical protein